MRKVIDYILVTGTSYKLTESVNTKLRAGLELYGNPFYRDHGYIAQAMVKYAEPSDTGPM